MIRLFYLECRAAGDCFGKLGAGRFRRRAAGKKGGLLLAGLVAHTSICLRRLAGGGGLDLGVMLAEPGYQTRAFFEWEDWPRTVLVAAQRAGYFAPAPIWDDLRSLGRRR